MNRLNKRVFAGVCVGLAVGVMPAPAFSYDREAAVLYARKWGTGATPNVLLCNVIVFGDRNTYPSDCANFASQCLMAGGIRFRVNGNDPHDNTKNYNILRTWESFKDRIGIPANAYSPLFSARTYPIRSDDMTRYSRTVPAAEHLGHVSLPNVHSGKLYGPFIGSINQNDSVWDDVKPGDCLFEADVPNHFGHAMFISTVVKDANIKEIKYSAHSNDYVDKSLNIAFAENAGREFYIVCLPDAPRTMGITMWSGSNRFFTSGKTLFAAKGQQAMIGPNEDLIIRVQFDTAMDTSKVPFVGFYDERLSAFFTDSKVSEPVMIATFKPANSYNALGWSPDGRRWRGIVRKNQLPKSVNKELRIRVSAVAEDGGTLDVNNHLRGYEPSTSPVLAGVVQIDTRQSAGKSN